MAPENYRPEASLLQKLTNRKIIITDDITAGADRADVLYTDVWVSMGLEDESARRLRELASFQINEQLVARAASDALVLHCLPAYRGREITEETLEKHAADHLRPSRKQTACTESNPESREKMIALQGAIVQLVSH